MQKCFNLHDAQHLYPNNIFKTLTNERTINRIVDKIFVVIDSCSKLIIVFEIFMQNLILDFFQCALICLILKHFEFFFFKWR